MRVLEAEEEISWYFAIATCALQLQGMGSWSLKLHTIQFQDVFTSLNRFRLHCNRVAGLISSLRSGVALSTDLRYVDVCAHEGGQLCVSILVISTKRVGVPGLLRPSSLG